MAESTRWRWVGRAAFAVGLALVLGIQWREDRYSCQLCRAVQEVRTTSLVYWALARHEVLSRPGVAAAGHRHDWWPYSYHYRNGLGGCLGEGVGCKPYQYKVGSTAP